MRLSVEQLALKRGTRILFENLSFAAVPGAYIEIEGANGAGKTSLLRALAGWLKPHAGAIRYEGAEAPALALHMIAHADGLKGALPARAHARYWAALLGGDGARADAALERVALSAIGDLPARALSRGQARRLALTRLLAAPRLYWLLDEPTAGLDAAGKALVAELIIAHVRGGGVAIAARHEPLGPRADEIVRLA